MPPTQIVNVATSPFFCSSSLESGSQQYALEHHDHASWTSALSSKAHSRRSGDAGWVSVTLDPVDETTWQEEAHWMSFHHAIQSLVVSCQNMERSSAAAQRNRNATTTNLRKSLFTDSPNTSQKSLDHTGDSSLAHSVTRQVAKADRVPVKTIHVTFQEDREDETKNKMQQALDQAEQDEWEVTGSPAS